MKAAVHAASLIANAPCCTILPAGAGKTEILASACGLIAENGGRTLLLTHTNTGVAALRRRLVKLGADTSSTDVRTIASWSLRWCKQYPLLGEMPIDAPGFLTDYNTHYEGASKILGSQALSKVLKATWNLVLVDEYQDCTLPQHEIVLTLSRSLPVVLVGDPLQSVYNFPGNPVVNWELDVFDAFPVVAVESQPYRWANANVQLGSDLGELRHQLRRNNPVDLRQFFAIKWTRATPQSRISSAKRTATKAGTSLVVTKVRPQSVNLAKSAGGLLEAMEDLAGEGLITLAANLDNCEPSGRPALIIEFAQECISKFPGDFKKRAHAVMGGQTPIFQGASRLGPFTQAAIDSRDGSVKSLYALCDSIGQLPNIVIARREIWTDLQQSLLHKSNDPDLTFVDAARLVRSRIHERDRHKSSGIAATTLLVKGLEFDNVFVADADELSTEELYVAMTRACHYLEVSSEAPIITPISNRSQ